MNAFMVQKRGEKLLYPRTLS